MRDILIERLWETFTEVLRADGGQQGAWKAEQKKKRFGCILVMLLLLLLL